MSQICTQLHHAANKLPVHQFPFDLNQIPRNGIYILFEKGEYAHGANRIVRVGTHTGVNQLRSRLSQHFMKENKDRSIFRKNIGRALLNRANDLFLDQWEIDLTTTKAKRRYAHLLNSTKKLEIEKKVSEHIQRNFRFATILVNEKEKRLFWESKMISSISLCKSCKASEGWLGQFSPKEKIKESGLWLVNQLYKEPLSEAEATKLLLLMHDNVSELRR